jgi:hypothetical protein
MLHYSTNRKDIQVLTDAFQYLVVCTKVRGRETTLIKNTLAAEHGGEVERPSPALFVCALRLPVTQLTMRETFSIKKDRSDA